MVGVHVVIQIQFKPTIMHWSNCSSSTSIFTCQYQTKVVPYTYNITDAKRSYQLKKTLY